ncbi:electron transfer flavoprotein subunit alpha/FixB family protein [Mucilaginibacter rubeus]|uniref:Electron transfer flavoprotein subunit alpha/FixB family protein n=1 Tax=Mucilaginibacter rubeus TaxID=2027860 RepID=A0AAE6JF13_9SPHI|nr:MULTISPECIES: electron transfer flavoprotein subunit alpha/FixB family protein [Mucilaginibacter]QEM04103.1 electron transfer flavoprotein subunit alpha/FixB family protein [Mucilaginibacter rubeus]QEM16706.1 electron transfer flavoprotein subunit alpha/FixB family protein [Mucilaginibacter gossypii]QTE46819.1 electron transfer flavoprotein subunit alpha/FixB family protein [Mucilaginibacter rubeus]QTE53416.1 electron transfer flavoprotein subunit alpha/FixB family protein [Mucilaginibacter 
MSVLIYAENTGGKFKKSVFEAVSYARAIADQNNTSLTAVSIGNVDATELALLSKYGANKVLNVSGDKLKEFVNQAYASVIAEAAKKEGSAVVVLSNTFSGRGLAPRIGIKLGAGVADGAVALPEQAGGSFKVKKTAFSGKAFATVELTSAIKVIALVPNSYQVVETAVAAQVEDFSVETKASDFKAMIKEIVRSTDKVSLPDAEIVVSGGRGLKGPENWGIIEDLASLLGAATACSKPVSDAGWRPHSEHVGQTGIAVSPNLYIAVGISGAIQHLAGVSSSKVIVVINKDPEAPFFKVADYGIVGDAFEVLPKLIAAVKEYKASV